MKVEGKLRERLAKTVALVCMLSAGLVFGVSSGSAGFGAAFSPSAVGVPPSADLAVSVSDSSDPDVIGTGFADTMTVTNNGPDPATGVYLQYALSAGLSLKSVSGANCDGATCVLGDMKSGEQAQLVLYVYGTKTGVVSAAASVASQTADPNPDNDRASEQTTIVDRQAPRAALNVVAHVVNDNGGAAKPRGFCSVLAGVTANR